MNGRHIAFWIVFFVAFLICKRFIPWFGSLPGDIEIRKENLYVALPIVSCLLLSIVLSLLASIIRRF
ncbi:hypothetical protein PDESU_02435 [Pontiella desulfatans]|uniref:DUF2905 domain-containing protein n=1 Tax=Pontiella desulfatans TaxID=2750659 RepID=A0A6C2U1N3_PONDE|nr:DUF2905 family protein [Pontiella desulfatans]VGO13878.1 hypothetical protein PDESU_02435 [Pontiella desulfatans]